MTFRLFTILSLFICLSLSNISLYAQDKTEDNSVEKNQEVTPDQQENISPPQNEEDINIPGDVIYLKSGKKMKGVQVLRELPDKIEVQISENIEPLILPRRLVQSIEYDNIDPLKEKGLKEELAKTQSNAEDIIPGEELSKEFNQKMIAPLSDQPIVYENEGLLKILNDLTNKIGVKLEVDESIKTIPLEQRKKSFNISPGTSLYKFLQTDFATAYPMISVIYKYDKVNISLKTAPTLSQPPTETAPPQQ
ncbi:MAG TPA: hypothetical protein PK813_10845 [Candidatus Hydrogenedens sp.]|nr:hypothetical protein [Candidatus Hydrogenedens sp.]